MAVALSSGQQSQFISDFPGITPDMLGQYGLYVNDNGTFVLVYALSGGAMGYLDVTSQASDLGISGLAPGQAQLNTPTTGQIQGAGIFDILANVPSNVTVDTSFLSDAASSASSAVASFAQAAGSDIGSITNGLTSGLSNITFFGLSIPELALIAAAAYIGFLLLPGLLARRAA